MSCPALLQLVSAHSEMDENNSLWARTSEEHVVPLFMHIAEKEQLLRAEDARTHMRKHDNVCEDTHKVMGGDRGRDVHLERRSREAVRSKEQGTKRVRRKERQQETKGMWKGPSVTPGENRGS